MRNRYRQNPRGEARSHAGAVAAALAAFCLILAGCTEKRPIPVGFAAELTGRQAELGIQVRNGALLAVDDINASGGIGGHPIELLQRDDLGTPDGARAADRELIDAGVAAIIGHTTSKQAQASIPVIDAARVILLSPTASSSALSGASPFFFRAATTNQFLARNLARHIHRNRSAPRMALLYDSDNAAYAKTYADHFGDSYRALGGKLAGEFGFSSSTLPDFAPLLEQLRKSGAEGLLIVAADTDTALVVQRCRLLGWEVPLYATGWSQTEVLLNNGGKALEGLEMDQSYPQNQHSPALQTFLSRYRIRFGREPSFGANLGHEAMMILASALINTGGKRDGLREALLATRDFPGLIDVIAGFDERGDVLRPFYISTVRDGRFTTIDSIEPGNPGIPK